MDAKSIMSSIVYEVYLCIGSFWVSKSMNNIIANFNDTENFIIIFR